MLIKGIIKPSARIKPWKQVNSSTTHLNLTIICKRSRSTENNKNKIRMSSNPTPAQETTATSRKTKTTSKSKPKRPKMSHPFLKTRMVNTFKLPTPTKRWPMSRSKTNRLRAVTQWRSKTKTNRIKSRLRKRAPSRLRTPKSTIRTSNKKRKLLRITNNLLDSSRTPIKRKLRKKLQMSKGRKRDPKNLKLLRRRPATAVRNLRMLRTATTRNALPMKRSRKVPRALRMRMLRKLLKIVQSARP